MGSFGGDGGEASLAKLNRPYNVFGNSDGSIYIADTFNHRIRTVNSSRYIETVAGNGEQGFNGENISATAASLNFPHSIWLDTLGRLYIADTGNHIIRQVSNNIMNTIAGTPGVSGIATNNLNALSSQLSSPVGIFGSDYGIIYVTDSGNNVVRSVYPNAANDGNLTVPSYYPSVSPTSLSTTNKPSQVTLKSPTTSPTYIPSKNEIVPTSAPICLEWILGFSAESCSQTCFKIGGTCIPAYFETITALESFTAMVESSFYLKTKQLTGDASTFCNLGIKEENTLTAPSAFSYVIERPNGTVDYTTCSYPTSIVNVTSECSALTMTPPAQRFCPCISPACDTAIPTVAPTEEPTAKLTVSSTVFRSNLPSYYPSVSPTSLITNNPSILNRSASPTSIVTYVPSYKNGIVPTSAPICLEWILGYSAESCSQTCFKIGGTCMPAYFETITTLESFKAMVESSFYLKTKQLTGDASTFCNLGINEENTLGAPSAFSYVIESPNGKVDYTLCILYLTIKSN
jgi:hypothetical protein